MNLDDLKQSGRIIFECIAGSRAFNLHLPEKSDFDVRGIYVNPSKEYLGLTEPAGQISDEKQDVVYYSLKRFFELIQSANPTLLELLWMPQETIKVMSTTMEKLIANRSLFISKKAYFTHAKYAESQIKKAKGANKKVHNPQPEERPKKEDFCWIIPSDNTIQKYAMIHFDEDALNVFHTAPYRSIPLKHFRLDLKEFHCAGLEHVSNTYRLYFYGEGAKGIFRGDDMLATESIPLEEEFEKFYGLLIYDKSEYEKAVRDWHSYHEWVRNRNNNRWLDQEKGLVHYDCYLEKETEFLTNSGWKKYDEITRDDKIATIDKNHCIIYQDFTNRHSSKYNGDIFTFESVYTRFSVTPNHKLYVSNCHRKASNYFTVKYNEKESDWKLETVKDYFLGRKSYKHILVATQPKLGCKKNALSDDIIRLFGAYLSEGSIAFAKSTGKPYALYISQLEGGRLCKHMEAITTIPIKISIHNRKGRNELTYRISDKNIVEMVYEECGYLCQNKKIPSALMTCNLDQIKLFLDVMIAGDGHNHSKGHSIYYSTSSQLMEGLQLLLFKNGFATQIYGPYQHKNPRFQSIYQLFISRSKKQYNVITKLFGRPTSGWKKTQVSNERIVCFSVPNETLITRNNNKIAIQGNSKNLTHCMRLLISGENILTQGFPIVRFEGAQREYLMAIRRGEFEYDFLMEEVEKRMARLEELYKTSTIPHSVDMKKIEKLYLELSG